MRSTPSEFAIRSGRGVTPPRRMEIGEIRDPAVAARQTAIKHGPGSIKHPKVGHPPEPASSCCVSFSERPTPLPPANARRARGAPAQRRDDAFGNQGLGAQGGFCYPNATQFPNSLRARLSNPLESMVSPVGLEPTAPRLKVSCSTN